MTENEKILKAEVDDLKETLKQVTMYLANLKDHLDSHSASDLNSQSETYYHQFYNESDVVIYLPFYVSPGDGVVNVFEEVSPGKFRQVTPVIELMGNQVCLSFDMPKSGFATVAHDEVNHNPDYLPVPPSYFPVDTMLLEELEPEQEETFDDEEHFKGVMGAIEKWQR